MHESLIRTKLAELSDRALLACRKAVGNPAFQDAMALAIGKRDHETIELVVTLHLANGNMSHAKTRFAYEETHK